MKDILINFDKFYINQGDPNFADIRFKNNATVRIYGCGVCCASMIICKTLDLINISDKQDVIRKVIADATNAKGLLTYSKIEYDGKVFKFKKGIVPAAALEDNEACICKLNGHFVVINGYDSSKTGDEAYLVKDPGSAVYKNLRQPMQKYGEIIKDIIKLELLKSVS